ncbi:MAG: hypothetical protein JW850_08930 [Thermoflexales bacterium]|nr:hypothetical protein [Thermoflexales bacterium]
MNKRKMLVLLAALGCLLLASSALAMSSANYRLDWFIPLTGSGGGPGTSASYAANLTVGQVVIGASSSANYGTGLGYWYGITGGIPLPQHYIYLPTILRNIG